MPYALSTRTCGFRRSSSVQFMPSRSASPWKLTSRRRWLRSRVRSRGGGLCSVGIQVVLLIGRPVRTGGVVLERNEVLRPRGEHGGDDTPGLLRFVTANL